MQTGGDEKLIDNLSTTDLVRTALLEATMVPPGTLAAKRLRHKGHLIYTVRVRDRELTRWSGHSRRPPRFQQGQGAEPWRATPMSPLPGVVMACAGKIWRTRPGTSQKWNLGGRRLKRGNPGRSRSHGRCQPGRSYGYRRPRIHQCTNSVRHFLEWLPCSHTLTLPES